MTAMLNLKTFPVLDGTMNLLERFGDWQRSFDGSATVTWMSNHTEIPVFVTAVYLAFVFWGQQFMEQRSPLNLKPVVAVWNFMLSTFSIGGALVTLPYLFDVMRRHPEPRWLFCTNAMSPEYYYHGVVGAWSFLFCWSKIPELLDTVFLVLQKKPVIFLHWFHHFTVMLFCWHSWTNAAPTGLFFSTMNFSVHAIMYTYYFFMCFSWGRKLVRPFAIFITLLQILQMVGGITISVVAFGYLMEESKPCTGVDAANVKLSLAMYVSYFILFSALFKKLYLTPKPKGHAAGDSASGSPTDRQSPTAVSNGNTKKRQ